MEPLHLVHLAEGRTCYVCGPDNPAGLGARYVLEEDTVRGTWLPRPEHEGWSGLVHGGVFGALHDEAAAWCMIALAGQTGFTVRMEQTFRRPLRLGQAVDVVGRVAEANPRGGAFATELRQGGELASAARTEYVFSDAPTLARVLGRDLSPQLQAWLEADPPKRRELVRAHARAGSW
jgi:acyl-coenzyme A thioesterase PaaI-like protein